MVSISENPLAQLRLICTARWVVNLFDKPKNWNWRRATCLDDSWLVKMERGGQGQSTKKKRVFFLPQKFSLKRIANEKTCFLLRGARRGLERTKEASTQRPCCCTCGPFGCSLPLVGTHQHTWGQDMLFEHLMAEQGVGLDVFSHGDYIAGTWAKRRCWVQSHDGWATFGPS